MSAIIWQPGRPPPTNRTPAGSPSRGSEPNGDVGSPGRAEAADHRAASAEEAARKATERAAEAEASLSRLHVEMAKGQSAMGVANQRASAAERLHEQARADLQAERDRHDTSLSQLHEQLAQLIARKPTRRPATKSASAKKRSTPSS